MSNLIEELKWRGFIEQIAGEDELSELLQKEMVTCYCGFDPSAASLQVGNFVAIMLLANIQRYGHKPIALVGGGTGMIGDPSGKSKERNLLDAATLENNGRAIRAQLSRFLDFENGENKALLLNNGEWLGTFGFIDFLRDVGKYFRVGDMLAKESVKNRISREEGMSYTEFSYMLLQSYDYLHLYDNYNCRLQVGGSDQWGNITSGMDLIRRVRQASVFALTNPLLTNADGQKLGKTAGGTVYLDKNLTSVFNFYQFWIRAEDSMVVQYLKLLTFLSKEEIAQYEKKVAESPESRDAQKRLAYEITKLVHGSEEADMVIKASNVLYGEEIKGLSIEILDQIFSEVPSVTLEKKRFEEGVRLTDLLAETGLSQSKGAARKLLTGGGVYINNVREENVEKIVTLEDMAAENIVILRSGKRNYVLVRLT